MKIPDTESHKSIVEQAPMTALRRSLQRQRPHASFTTVVGPILISSMDEMDAIKSFLSEQFKNKQSYMLSAEQQALERELGLHERGAYFVAKRDSAIVGVIRICPGPFEFERLLADKAIIWPDFSHYVEISRFIVSKKEAATSASILLLIDACGWAMSHGYEGIVALCRPAASIMFERYGMSMVCPDFIPIGIRNNQKYALVASRWRSLILSTTRFSDATVAKN